MTTQNVPDSETYRCRHRRPAFTTPRPLIQGPNNNPHHPPPAIALNYPHPRRNQNSPVDAPCLLCSVLRQRHSDVGWPNYTHFLEQFASYSGPARSASRDSIFKQGPHRCVGIGSAASMWLVDEKGAARGRKGGGPFSPPFDRPNEKKCKF